MSNIAANFSSPIEGPINFRSFYCLGLEERLIDCLNDNSFPTNENNCESDSIYYYAAVQCSDLKVTCTHGTIQVKDGIVNICAYGELYTLCGDEEAWNKADAEVVCRNLGQNPNGAKNNTVIATDEDEPYQIRFHCSGDEQSLVECPVTLDSRCDDKLLATVECGEMPQEPQNVKFDILSDGLNISWTVSINATYQAACTAQKGIFSHILSHQISVTNNSIIFNGLLPNTEYECCVISVVGEVESYPVCKTFTTPPLPSGNGGSSCKVLLSSTVMNDECSNMTVLVSPTGNSNIADSSSMLNSAIPWIVGFIVGVVISTVVSLLLCGCFFILRTGSNRKRSIITENDIIDNNNIQTPVPLQNPLYDSNYLAEENMTTSYAYVNGRLCIVPYDTVQLDNDNKVSLMKERDIPYPTPPNKDDETMEYSSVRRDN